MMDYDTLISQRVRDIKPSGIRKFFDIAATMTDVISLSIGEPDFVTPWPVRDAGIESLVSGRTFYTPNAGLIELRRAICEYYARMYGLSYRPEDETLVTVGGSEAIDMCIRTLVGAGDEVIVPEPSFVCYSPLVSLAGGTPVTVNTLAENDFRLTPEQLRGALTERTKLLILPYPNNPTGAVMDRADLQALADILQDTDVTVLTDELYAALSYTGGHVSFASLDGMKERTVVINGFSKAYAMTGWRLGYALGPSKVIKQMTKVHQFAVMCSPTMAQDAAMVALSPAMDEKVDEMRQEYDMRRRVLLKRFAEMGVDCFEPRGAFYAFPSVRKFGLSSEEFCMRLLNEQHVAIVPGSAFGASGEGFVRISYAKGIDDIEAALARMKEFIATL